MDNSSQAVQLLVNAMEGTLGEKIRCLVKAMFIAGQLNEEKVFLALFLQFCLFVKTPNHSEEPVGEQEYLGYLLDIFLTLPTRGNNDSMAMKEARVTIIYEVVSMWKFGKNDNIRTPCWQFLAGVCAPPRLAAMVDDKLWVLKRFAGRRRFDEEVTGAREAIKAVPLPIEKSLGLILDPITTLDQAEVLAHKAIRASTLERMRFMAKAGLRHREPKPAKGRLDLHKIFALQTEAAKPAG